MNRIVLFALTLLLPWTAFGQLSFSAYRVLGQPDLRQNGFNSVEGREMANPAGVAVDERDGTVRLYVADASNNRVLAWRDIGAAMSGGPADLALGQPSLRHTAQNGIGAGGLASPSGVAVDPQTGDVYVSDSENHRVLRFIDPFSNVARVEPEDVYGQPNFLDRAPNGPGLSERSLRSPLGLRFDAAGNLWICDAGNHRLLRYPRAALTSDQPEADLVLGQPSFETGTANGGMNVNAAGFNLPAGLAFHPNGSLYVADAQNARVLVFPTPFTSGMQASRVLGQPEFTTRQVPPSITAFAMRGPNSLHIDSAGNLFVAIGQENRILVFNQVAQKSGPLPSADRVIGQPFLDGDRANIGTFPRASASGLNGPGDVIGDSSGNIYVADTSNHRTVIFANGTAPATKVLGQPDFSLNAPNRAGPTSLGSVTSITIDYSSEPFPLYLADATNSRILAWSSAIRFENGAPADLVIGQADFVTSIANSDTGRAQTPTPTSLAIPRGIAVDADGNLWVADTANNRAVRFPRPFDQADRVRADIVLGQTGFFTAISAAVSNTSLRAPRGIAVGADGQIYVADTGNNRVLEYPPNPPSGAPAIRVFGQANFDIGTAATTVSAQTLSAPEGIWADALNFLYVADTGANRVLVYPISPDGPAAASSAAFVLGQETFSNGGSAVGLTRLAGPRSVASDSEGRVYVADTGNNRVMRFPSLLELPTSGGAADQIFGQGSATARTPNFNSLDGLATAEAIFAPSGLFLDRQGTMWLGDTGNSRVTHYLRRAVGLSAARFEVGAPVSPGSLVALFGAELSEEQAGATAAPLPTTLANRFIEVNDQFRAPLLFISPGQANMQLPVESPGGLQRIAVRDAETEELLAGGPIVIDVANPGLFTVSQDGLGQALALNQNGTLNGADNPARRGQVIQLFGTGQGRTNPVIPDGQPTPTSSLTPTVAMPGTTQLECLSPNFVCAVIGSSGIAKVQFSGLAPGFVGLWQINVEIPADIPNVMTGSAIPVRVVINQRFSNSVTIAIQ